MCRTDPGRLAARWYEHNLRLCARRPKINMMRLLQGQADNAGCCFPTVGNATKAQLEFVHKHHDRCTVGNLINQVQLRWRASDVLGVGYYVGQERNLSVRLWERVGGLLCDFASARRESSWVHWV
jgi:hypothetical protein